MKGKQESLSQEVTFELRASGNFREKGESVCWRVEGSREPCGGSETGERVMQVRSQKCWE